MIGYPDMKRTRLKIGALIAAIAIILASTNALSTKGPGKENPTVSMIGTTTYATYTEDDYGFQVTYPTSWAFSDRLKSDGTTKENCCVFIADGVTSTTTGTNSDGQAYTSVSVQDHVQLQIGSYDRSKNDPFKSATTTKVKIGAYDWYVATVNGSKIFLLPRNDNEGLGVAEFDYTNKYPEHIKIAAEIISTIKLLPR